MIIHRNGTKYKHLDELPFCFDRSKSFAKLFGRSANKTGIGLGRNV